MIQELIIIGVAGFTLVGLIIGIVRLRYRNGLMVRIFSMVFPAMGIVAFLGVVLGKLEATPFNLVVVITPAAVVATVTLLWLHRVVVRSLALQMEELMANVAQLSATAKQTAATANEQAATVTQISTTIDEINQIGSVTSDAAHMMLEISSSAVNQSQEGLVKIAEAIQVIVAMGEVTDIVGNINDLAEQSNLLAVNASIEAAKAGEFGRGFAVVANEVRNLAGQSKQATGKIRRTIGRTEEGRQAVERVDSIIGNLSKVLQTSAERAKQISLASSQQSAGIGQITAAMKNVAQGGHNTAAAASQLELSVSSLTKVGVALRTFIIGG